VQGRRAADRSLSARCRAAGWRCGRVDVEHDSKWIVDVDVHPLVEMMIVESPTSVDLLELASLLHRKESRLDVGG
jgi:hypothetical protein